MDRCTSWSFFFILCFLWDCAAAVQGVVKLKNRKNTFLDFIFGATSLSEVVAHIQISRVTHHYTAHV